MWDNKQKDVVKKQGQYNAAFYILIWRLYLIIVEEVGELAGYRFLNYIKDYIRQYLQAIPQYNYNKLFIIYKVFKHYLQEV